MRFILKYLKNLWRELGYETHFWIGAFLWCALGGVLSYSPKYSYLVNFLNGFKGGFLGFTFYLLTFVVVFIIQSAWEVYFYPFFKKVYDKTKEEETRL